MDGDAGAPREAAGAATNDREGAMPDMAGAMLEAQRRAADAMAGIGSLALDWVRAAGDQQMALARQLADEVTRALLDIAGAGAPQDKAGRLLALARTAGALGLDNVAAVNGLALRFSRAAMALGAAMPGPGAE